jgi:hypothetical protein
MHGAGWGDGARGEAILPLRAALPGAAGCAPRAAMIASPLRRFLLAALLWLPLTFFLWFSFANVWVWPVVALAKPVLLHVWPSLFTEVVQGADLLDAQGRVLAHPGYLVQLSSGVLVDVAVAGAPPRLGYLEPVVNPMIYGYALPLFAGLVLATPLSAWRRAVQIVGGGALILITQTFGVIAESLKRVGLDAGPSGLAALREVGLAPEWVALGYQFGYLILPSLVPAVLWIVCNRRFIDDLVRSPVTEPTARSGVVSSANGGE